MVLTDSAGGYFLPVEYLFKGSAMSDYSVILFHSNNYSIWASNVLEKKGYKHKMVPVPRQFSSDCGYCVRIARDDVPAVKQLLEETGVEFDKIENI
jgi:hypothetical protein